MIKRGWVKYFGLLILILLIAYMGTIMAHQIRKWRYLSHINSQYPAERRYGFIKLNFALERNLFKDKDLMWAALKGLYDEDHMVQDSALNCLAYFRDTDGMVYYQLEFELYNDHPPWLRIKLLQHCYFKTDTLTAKEPLFWLIENYELTEQEMLAALECFPFLQGVSKDIEGYYIEILIDKGNTNVKSRAMEIWYELFGEKYTE